MSGTAANDTVIIPAVELTGSQRERLRLIDAQIARLERLRRALVGAEKTGQGSHEYASPIIGEPSWPWCTAGVLLGALFVVLALVARGCA